MGVLVKQLIAFLCRFVAPARPEQRTIHASSPEEAAMIFHDENSDVGYAFRHELPDDRVEYIRFARVAVSAAEGDGKEEPLGKEELLVTRMYNHGIFRKGGVPRRGTPRTLAEIATALDYQDDPATLIEPGWELEETKAEAEERQTRRWTSQQGEKAV